MRLLVLSFAVLLTAQISLAQTTFKVTVKDQETGQPVVGAKVSVAGTEISAVTDADGWPVWPASPTASRPSKSSPPATKPKS